MRAYTRFRFRSGSRRWLANAFRAHLAEFGIVVAQGIRHVRALIERVFGEDFPLIFLPWRARLSGLSSRS